MTLESWERIPGLVPTIRWHLSRPFRTLAGARLPRGRGFFGRMAARLGWRTVVRGSVITAATPGGSSVTFSADTMLGRILWTEGGFEQGELEATLRLAKPGTSAFDVGANVGLFTVVMSRAVGPSGRVLAIEPVAGTVHQLRLNLQRNQCTNVEVIQGAAAAVPGDIPLYLTDDPALHSAGGEPISGHPMIRTINATAYTLDELWIASGRPAVSLVKIDVEGAEEAVLLGALQMIGSCRPALIIEVNDPRRVARVGELLNDYRAQRASRFERWNHLMMPN